MTSTYQLSAAGRLIWGTALVGVPVLAVGALFTVTDDGIVPFQNSELAIAYTATTPRDVQPEVVTFPTTFGRDDGARTLVLYDDRSSFQENAEMYAIATANLATHFGQVEILAIDRYEEGLLDEVDAAIYVGTDHLTDPPQELLDDVRTGEVPVLWIGQNIEDVVEGKAPAGIDFVTQYGWDPDDPLMVLSDDFPRLDYKGRTVQRVTHAVEHLNVPMIVDEDAVEVLVAGVCADRCATHDTDEEVTHVPWAVRSGNLTYLTELPFHYIDENQLYLVFADLYYDLLAPDTEPVRRATVRLEDVGPEADPDQLRAVADYLHGERVPFQVAVVPITIDRTPDRESWYGLSLLDRPEVVEALKYMQERGGTLIQHGTTHQYGGFDNPYSGRSGEDYEFYRYGCSRTEFPPFEWEGCRQDSWVRKLGPVPEDDVADHSERLQRGREVMIDAGLGAPDIFETPHYTASINAYRAMAEAYEARYEQVEYYAGMISSGETSSEFSYGQIFPYTVHDIYGSTVYPENLQNVTEAEQNNHAVRTPQTIIDRAEANLVVRESTASFYFHPFLDLEYLREMVEGIRGLDYTFVPVHDLP